MVAEWAKFCQASDLVVDSPHILITFGDDRRHRVTVEENADEYVLRAFVVRQVTVEALADLPLQVWSRNRAVSLPSAHYERRHVET